MSLDNFLVFLRDINKVKKPNKDTTATNKGYINSPNMVIRNEDNKDYIKNDKDIRQIDVKNLYILNMNQKETEEVF